MADFQGFFMLFIVLLVSSMLMKSLFSRNKAKARLPPSPFSLPIIGHLHLLAPIVHQAFHKLSTRYGPIMHLSLGSVCCVVASSPETAKEFLKTHEASFSNRPTTLAVDYLTYGSADFSFAPYGPYWKFMKKLCMSELLGGRTLDQLLPVRREEIVGFLRVVLKKANAGESIDVGAELMTLTNNIICRMTIGQRCSDDENGASEVRKLIKDVAEITGEFNLSDYILFCKNLDLQGFRKRLKRIRESFEFIMDKTIKEHEEKRRKRKEASAYQTDEMRDLIDMLLDISEDDNSEMKLTMENIKAFIMDIFAAGTDTSAITMEWALAELINHPQMMERARKEIDSVVGGSRLVEESDIVNLPYLQAVVKETLRLHPTGPIILRESAENSRICGYEIPAKTRLFVNVWAVGRDPNHWENPVEFKPERFIDQEGSLKSQLEVRGQHFHLIPFGSGRRGCPGTSLALHVVQANLAAMIQCFEWKAGGGRDTVDMQEGPGITLPRANPLICDALPRLKPLISVCINGTEKQN